MIRPKTIALLVGAVFAAAAVDGNFTHMSTAATAWPAGGAPAFTTTVPPAGAPASGPRWAAPMPLAGLKITDPHSRFPAVDVPIPPAVALHSMIDGTVDYVGGDCGLGILVTAEDGTTVKFCHSSRRQAVVGQHVTAGQVIAYSGSTGHSTGPHLHLEVTAPGGSMRCPQTLLVQLRSNGTGPAVTDLPTSGCIS